MMVCCVDSYYTQRFTYTLDFLRLPKYCCFYYNRYIKFPLGRNVFSTPKKLIVNNKLSKLPTSYNACTARQMRPKKVYFNSFRLSLKVMPVRGIILYFLLYSGALFPALPAQFIYKQHA